MARLGQRTNLKCGPVKGVRFTVSPYDDDPSYLYNAQNMYVPEPDGQSGIYGRPGFSLLNSGNKVYTSGRAQGGYAHTDFDNVSYNFYAAGGKLYRADQSLVTFTDVTPVGVTIDPGNTTRVKFVSLDGQMVVSDGVNPPWIASNFASTPITGTYIDFDGSGTDWDVQDITVFSGAVVVLAKTLGGVGARATILWSAPGDPNLGYQQPNFDYAWTLEQTSSKPIFCIHGTNIGLFYFRQNSIGLLTGALGPDFQTTHTDDAVADNVGSESPQTILGFSNRLFFTDQIGRPWMLPLGGAPIPIWQNMRAAVDAAQTSYQSVTAVVSTAVIEPTLNLYLAAIWSQTPSIAAPCDQAYCFDAQIGGYVGFWTVTSGTRGQCAIELLCTFLDNVGRSVLMAFGSKDTAPADSGYAWSFNALLGQPDRITQEDGGLLLTEDLSDALATEGQAEVWMDNGVLPVIAATTVRLGYATDFVWNFDLATAIVGSDTPVTMRCTTPTVANVLEATPSPSPSQDGTFRVVGGLEIQGRGLELTISPTTATEQFSFQQASVAAVPSLASWDEP